MGFFSWECKSDTCDHRSIISSYATSGHNAWMINVTAICEDGSILKGDYDGYGRLLRSDGGEIELDGMADNIDFYHTACWEVDGKPTDYKGGSDYAGDQGYFFDDKDYDIEDPRDCGVCPPRNREDE
jgi:hypothetical protein